MVQLSREQKEMFVQYVVGELKDIWQLKLLIILFGKLHGTALLHARIVISPGTNVDEKSVTPQRTRPIGSSITSTF